MLIPENGVDWMRKERWKGKEEVKKKYKLLRESVKRMKEKKDK